MKPFKVCPNCTYTWKSRDDFLQDPFVCLVGFQFNFNEKESGYYLFNHVLDGDHCNSTLAMKVEAFLSMYKGPIFTEVKFGSPTCEGHCKNLADMTECTVECKNAVARNIMQDFSQCKG